MQRPTSRKMLAGAVGMALVAAGVAFAPFSLANAIPNTPPIATDPAEGVYSDDLPNALEEARRDAREEAIAGVLTGKYATTQRGTSTVVDLGADAGSSTRGGNRTCGGAFEGGRKQFAFKPRYVELAREATDQIFVILVEFGDTASPYPPDPDAQRTEGPLHNEIPEPDRAVDNSTVWRSDYSQSYFQDLYFGGGESLKNYMETQSSGRYSVNGEVTNWVKVDYTEGRYGSDVPCGSNVCSNVKALVRDAAKKWVEDQLASGRSLADVTADLTAFDVWDRYDIDADGNFDEPDGFLDHFQIVHSGGDAADGDPIYASDAIWSHRWYSNLAYGPSCSNPELACLTGTPIGGTIDPATSEVVDDGTFTGLLIGDYTIQPENGGRSVFYHEYAHDLGLPDDYNVLSGGDNNNEHWTLMAQSRLGAKDDGGIGERGGDLGAWNKLQLGWLNYTTVNTDQTKLIQLGPQEYNTTKPQAVVVNLPVQEVAIPLGEPAAGTSQWYSGHEDDSLFALYQDVSVPAGGGELRFKTRYDIETDWDYAYVAVDGEPVVGTINGVPTTLATNQNDATIGWDGTSTTWVEGVFPLPAGDHEVAIAYWTDGAAAGNTDAPDGVFIDDISVLGVPDGDGAAGWTAQGFELVGSALTASYPHFYIAGYRSYLSYDQYLKTGPYFFGYLPALPDKVDHYSYQEGLLVSYWNTMYDNNDTLAHPGVGRNLYIDAHPVPLARSSGELWRARIQVYDAPFGLRKTDTVNLHYNGALETFGGLRGVPTFDDTKTYWYESLPNHGVKLPGYGVKIRVLAALGGRMLIAVY